MEPILNLSPQEFRAALAELQLDPAREADLVRLYEEANAPQQGGRDRGMLRNLLDNIIGFDDEVVTPGERLGAGAEQFASGLLSDPIGMAGDIAQGGYETIERAMAPGATPMDVMGAAGMAMLGGGMVTGPRGALRSGLLRDAADETPAQQVARLLREGRADEVTDDLMAQADPQEMFRLYEAGETGMDLPMDEASRMVRAREMGVNTPGYHGSNVDFPAFRGMTYSSRTPEIADRYADDGVMYPIMTRSSDMATSAEENRIASNILSQSGFQGLGPQRSAISQELKRRGFAGVDDAVTALTFDPTNIRSRFARFDPRLSNLRNLSAANVDPLTGAAAVSASQQDDPLANLRAYIAAAGGVLPR